MLEKLGRAEASARFPEMRTVYEEAYGSAPVEPIINAQKFAELLPVHLVEREYTLLCAHSTGGMAGFCYGYVTTPKEWLGEMHTALPDELGASWRMLALCELVVSPAFQRRGLGMHLHNSLVDSLAPDFTALYVRRDNEPAWSVYRRLGYRRLGSVSSGPLDGPVYDALILDAHARVPFETPVWWSEPERGSQQLRIPSPSPSGRFGSRR